MLLGAVVAAGQHEDQRVAALQLAQRAHDPGVVRQRVVGEDATGYDVGTHADRLLCRSCAGCCGNDPTVALGSRPSHPLVSRRDASPGCPTGATRIERRASWPHGHAPVGQRRPAKDVAWNGQTVHTGIWKAPVTGPGMVRRLNIDGDGQGDLGGHGGEQRAVMVYQLESYEYWQEHFGRDDLDLRAVRGELHRRRAARRRGVHRRPVPHRRGRVRGHPAAGHLLPRRACAWASRGLPSLLVAHHRPGFYLRVITEGRVQAGDEIVRTRRRRRTRSRVAEIDALLYLPGPRPGRRCAGRSTSRRSAPAGRGRSATCWPTAARRRPAGEPAWTGFRPLRVADVVAESATGHLDLPGAPRRHSRCPRPEPGST